METAGVRAALFVKDLETAAAFYVGVLALTRVSGDKDHAVLECDGFELIVHQIPKQIADDPPPWADAMRISFSATTPRAINSASASASSAC